MERKQLKRQGGFTLIELITVIIILGILAAVIAPKYFNMSDQARQAAYDGALSEGVARFNMAYAQFILDTNSAPASLAAIVANANVDFALSENIGDFTLTYTGGGTGANVTITALRTGDTADATTGAVAGVTNTTSFAWPD